MKNKGANLVSEPGSIAGRAATGRMKRGKLEDPGTGNTLRMRASFSIPAEARGWSVDCVPLSKRLARVLREMGIQLLGDLEGLPVLDVFVRKGCGRKTLRELLRLLGKVSSGEFDELAAASSLSQVLKALNKAISALLPRTRDILLLRLGAKDERGLTLEEIGARYAITRERARQVLLDAGERLQRTTGPHARATIMRLEEDCLKSICPLTTKMLSQRVRAKATGYQFGMEFYVRLLGLLSPAMPAWPDGQTATGNMARKGLAQIELRLRKLLRIKTKPVALAEAFHELQRQGELPELTPGEFLETLKRSIVLKVDLASPGRPTVRSTKTDIRQLARLILSESSRLLKPEEIIERARKLIGPEYKLVAPSRLETALAPEHGFYMLDRRSFGLRQHFRLPQEQWPQVRSDFHQMLLNEKRPVSTVEVIAERRFGWAEALNSYEAAQILREDNRFTDLGRHLFALARWGIEKREYIEDIVPEVLAEAGRPLNSMEIYRRIKSRRSVTPTVSTMIAHHPMLQSYGFNYYGLKTWNTKMSKFLVSDAQFVGRAISRSGPPLTFGDLCRMVKVKPEGPLANRLWQTVRSLPKVKWYPDRQSPATQLRYLRWPFDRAIYEILISARRPMSIYDIQRKFNERFGPVYGEKSADSIENSMRRSHLFERIADGRAGSRRERPRK